MFLAGHAAEYKFQCPGNAPANLSVPRAFAFGTNMEIDYLTTCGECGQQFDDYTGLSHHLGQSHKGLTRKEYYDRYLKKPGDGVCVLCGRETKFTDRLNRGYYTHCSKKCTANDAKTVSKRKATSLELHGSEGYNNHEQTSRTKLERYGDPNYANGDQIRATKKERYGIQGFNNPEKRKATKLEKYGATNFVNSEKCAQTKLERYGSSTYNNSAKMQETKILKYGMPNFVNPDKSAATVKTNTISKYQKWVTGQCEILDYNSPTFHCRCLKCGNEFDILINTGFYRLFRFGIGWCTNCNPAEPSRSKEEQSLCSYVASLVGEENVRSSDRDTIQNTELDIYVPSKQVAIEFDSLYWHNETNKDNDYHIKKTEKCEEPGIKLIHVFEDEWHFKQDIVKSRIAGILGKNPRLYARSCSVYEMTMAESNDFLENNHIQGACSSKWRYGLYFEGTPVAVMTFGRNRFGEGIELLRFCTTKHLTVIGGASKLFKHFVDAHPEIKQIVSFADRRWSGKDAFYPKLGFTLDGITPPAYSYIINNMRHNRMEFTKKKLVDAGFDPNMSEHEIMLSRKIYRIYDCGNYRYVWKR